MITIRLTLRNDGARTRYDNEYLVEYDPAVRVDAFGVEYVHLVTSPKREEARLFDSVEAAIAFYRGTTGRMRRTATQTGR
jgi:hypothetical protein